MRCQHCGQWNDGVVSLESSLLAQQRLTDDASRMTQLHIESQRLLANSLVASVQPCDLMTKPSRQGVPQT
jgi:hypothetical protein